MLITKKICPKCGKNRIKRSKRKEKAENIISYLGFYPYRCSNCDKRFYIKAKTPVITSTFYTFLLIFVILTSLFIYNQVEKSNIKKMLPSKRIGSPT